MAPRPRREFEIFRMSPGSGGMYWEPTGLIVTSSTKAEAVRLGREKFGRGTYEAHVSSPEIRADQARRAADTRRLLGEQAIPTLVVGVDLDLASRR